VVVPLDAAVGDDDSSAAPSTSAAHSPIMNPMEDQQASQSAGGEAKVITLCGSTRFEAEFKDIGGCRQGCVSIP
jgi:hypothetical protein